MSLTKAVWISQPRLVALNQSYLLFFAIYTFGWLDGTKHMHDTVNSRQQFIFSYYCCAIILLLLYVFFFSFHSSLNTKWFSFVNICRISLRLEHRKGEILCEKFSHHSHCSYFLFDDFTTLCTCLLSKSFEIALISRSCSVFIFNFLGNFILSFTFHDWWKEHKHIRVSNS